LGKIVRAQGRTPTSRRVHIDAPSSDETAVLIQNLPVEAGRYVGTVWVKLDDPAKAADVTLSFRFRDKDGWYVGKGGRQGSAAATSGDWQKLMLAAALPKGATSVAVMLGASGTAATFDNALVYQMPE